MANDNKKINDLVSEDDDDTSELEVLTATVVFNPDSDYASESDAATHSFETSARSADSDSKSIAELKSDLQQREENISNLQYDIEELRARWTGLEKELKAREELTDNVTRELEQSNRKLAQTISLLKRRDSKITGLESALEQQSERLGEAGSALENAQQDAASLQAELKVLKERNQAAIGTIDSLNAELFGEKAKRQWAEDAERAHGLRTEQLEKQYDESLSAVATLQQYVEGRKANWDRQERVLRTSKRALKGQRKENSRLAREARRAAEQLRKEQAARHKLQAAHDSLQAELRKAQAESAALTASVAEAKASHRDKDEQIASLAREIAIAAPALEDARAERAKVETQLAALSEHSQALEAEVAALRDAYAARDASFAEQRDNVDALTQRLSAATDAAAAGTREREELANRLQQLQEHADRWQSEHAGLSGLVSSSEDEIRELGDRISKTEAYADTLREKLQQEQGETAILAAAREEARESLAEARRRIGALTDRLESQQQRTATLEHESEEAARRFDEEVSKLRHELSTAESAVEESRRLNEQLTSNLVESANLCRALENQLAEADAVRDRDIKGLSKQVAQLRQQIDDYERKISTKDAAINALLTELAHKPESAEDNAAADDVVHRLADRKSRVGDERPGHPEKDRVTRLLVGSIEGQELRFPLFKDKLTIGRTVHNDIQLKAQYVSRRHAVVITEDDHTRIVDWGSKNGIYVNGKRVSETMLANDDRVTVGTAEFRFEERPKR